MWTKKYGRSGSNPDSEEEYDVYKSDDFGEGRSENSGEDRIIVMYK